MKKKTIDKVSYVLEVITYGLAAVYSSNTSVKVGGVEGAILFICCLIAIKFMWGVKK